MVAVPMRASFMSSGPHGPSCCHDSVEATTIKANCSFFHFLLSKAVDFGGEGFWKPADYHSCPELATSCLCDLVTQLR